MAIYRWRWFKNKGVAITVLWNFSSFLVIYYLLHQFTNSGAASTDYKSLITLAAIGTSAVMFPLTGWLADVYVGRYQMIRACLRIMWLVSILYSILAALPVTVSMWYVDLAVVLLVVVSLSGFQANIIQFSLDQLFDSSSLEITSFVLFYVWSYLAANLVVKLAITCTYNRYKAIATLIFPIFLSLAVSLDFLFSHWLVKEPVAHNPLKLIFRVLSYAARNKYPHRRSAFTYWDDTHYSRIDLAKEKYGGPFSTEQVEDVKTFFKILVIVVVVCLFLGVPINSNKTTHTAKLLYFNGSAPGCFKQLLLDSEWLVVLGIPLWEFLLFPILWKCAMNLKFLRKLCLGMTFVIFYFLCCVSLEAFGQVSINETSACPLLSNKSSGNEHYTLSYWWLVLPNTFYDLGGSLIAVAGLQFVSAQCPYSMKGLMFGMVYLATGFSVCLFYPLSLPFKRDGFHGWGGLNCIFWYQLACIIACLVIGVVFLITISRYKNRQREENLPSQQFLADVYSEHMHTNKDVSMSPDQ